MTAKVGQEKTTRTATAVRGPNRDGFRSILAMMLCKPRDDCEQPSLPKRFLFEGLGCEGFSARTTEPRGSCEVVVDLRIFLLDTLLLVLPECPWLWSRVTVAMPAGVSWARLHVGASARVADRTQSHKACNLSGPPGRQSQRLWPKMCTLRAKVARIASLTEMLEPIRQARQRGRLRAADTLSRDKQCLPGVEPWLVTRKILHACFGSSAHDNPADAKCV